MNFVPNLFAFWFFFKDQQVVNFLNMNVKFMVSKMKLIEF